MNIIKVLIVLIVVIVIILILDKVGVDEYVESKIYKSTGGKIRYKNLVFQNPEMKSNKLKKVFKMISDIELIGISVMIFDENLESVLIQSKTEITDLYNLKKVEKIFEFIEKNDLGDRIALTSFKFKNIDLY